MIEVRPRAGFEAVDLGFRFARTVFRPLFVAHALVVGALAFALFASLAPRVWLACACLWWLKPLYDRVALYVLAEALFGRVPSVRETLAALPRLVVSTGLFASLTFLRLSPLRAFTLPVLQLEGLRGRARAERVRVLVGRDTRAGLGLLFACGAFEMVLFLAGLQLAASFRPEGEVLDFWKAALGGGGLALTVFEGVLYALAVCVIEPLYVAGGFALYVNRRVWLEGWDVEQAFRKLVRRLAPAALALALAMGAPGAALGDEPPAEAPAEPAAEAPATPSCVDWGPSGADACMQSVLASEELSTVEKMKIWLPRASESTPEEPGTLPEIFVLIADLGATLLRIGAWLSVALFVTALGLVIARSLRERERGRAPSALPVAPSVRFGLDLRPESLPPDVIAAARAAFAAGDAQAALSLLYRGALVHLVRGAGLRIPASATEGECERAAAAAVDSELAGAFSALTRAWTYCAYAHLPPEASAFDALCERWRAHLGARA